MRTQSRKKLEKFSPGQRYWNAEKTKDYEFAIPMQNGSRNQSLYDFGRRLKAVGIPMEQVENSMLLIYRYFCIDKDNSYTIDDVKASIASIQKLESMKRNEIKREPETSRNLGDEFDFVIPKPYFIKNNSLYRIEKKRIKGGFQETEVFVSRNVPFITKHFEHVEKSEIQYEICWNNKGRNFKETRYRRG